MRDDDDRARRRIRDAKRRLEPIGDADRLFAQCGGFL
jgi:hypothetical protein